MSAQPKFIDPLPEIPQVMKDKRQWVRWKLESRHGKLTKVPYRVDGKPAASDNPNDWTDYYTAVTGATINKDGGVGFMFAEGFAGIDLDGCRDMLTGEITWWATKIIESLDGVYVEVSPSGTGLHIFVIGTVPGADKKFNLNPAIGYGKAAIEVYDSRRYFTITGEPYYDEAGEVSACDLTKVYELFHQIRGENPAPRDVRVDSADAGEPTKVRWYGNMRTSKYNIFKTGEIIAMTPFTISDGVGELSYPSQSEADLAFCTVLALMHDGDEEKIWDEYVASSMARDKWLNRRDDFIRLTVGRATQSADKVKAKGQQFKSNAAPDAPAPVQQAANQASEASKDAAGTFPHGDNEIPDFDDSVITGIYRDIVNLVTDGTTIPKQFAFLAAKVFIGARMAGRVTFENLDADSSYYAVVIAETGTGKGLAWRRTVENCLMTGERLKESVKIIQSADSGAGLKDAFFDYHGNPIDIPIICYVDEVTSLGHKAGERKNPEIVDTFIELADGCRISRNLAGKKPRVHNNARLSVYMCGQNGEVIVQAFAGRKVLGIYDRMYPEYSPAIEAGDLPEITMAMASPVWAAINKLLTTAGTGQMTMGDGVKALVDEFWKSQPKEHRARSRWKKHLMLDMYMSAFGRGSMIADTVDWEAAKKQYLRQVIIREKHFVTEVPDKIGVYNSRIKALVERMTVRLRAGETIKQVAMSQRDFTTITHAYRDNDIHTFQQAWRNWEGSLLASIKIEGKNGQEYKKFVPIPDEDEVWKLE